MGLSSGSGGWGLVIGVGLCVLIRTKNDLSGVVYGVVRCGLWSGAVWSVEWCGVVCGVVRCGLWRGAVWSVERCGVVCGVVRCGLWSEKELGA